MPPRGRELVYDAPMFYRKEPDSALREIDRFSKKNGQPGTDP